MAVFFQNLVAVGGRSCPFRLEPMFFLEKDRLPCFAPHPRLRNASLSDVVTLSFLTAMPPATTAVPTTLDIPTNRNAQRAERLSAPTNMNNHGHVKLVVPLPDALKNSGEKAVTDGFIAKLKVNTPSWIVTSYLEARLTSNDSLVVVVSRHAFIC